MCSFIVYTKVIIVVTPALFRVAVFSLPICFLGKDSTGFGQPGT